ncbi:AAA domain-containing protein [Rhizobium laguerreae]|nr:AAA domain-containing protein [Rhizobium laguerreae]MBY3402928.1 AAA domain-containing protein [Rhizobium laguerreae]MBY3409867.1 AAA domain-containing protein [Rhizobium laguerreae]
MDRIFMMGNGGSGKTWLARQLAERLHHPAFHLDDFHWMPNLRADTSRDQISHRAST